MLAMLMTKWFKIFNMDITNAQLLIKDLNETQILSAIRERFAGEHVEGIDLEKLMDRSRTLGDLYAAIGEEMNRRDAPKAP